MLFSTLSPLALALACLGPSAFARPEPAYFGDVVEGVRNVPKFINKYAYMSSEAKQRVAHKAYAAGIGPQLQEQMGGRLDMDKFAKQLKTEKNPTIDGMVDAYRRRGKLAAQAQGSRLKTDLLAHHIHASKVFGMGLSNPGKAVAARMRILGEDTRTGLSRTGVSKYLPSWALPKKTEALTEPPMEDHTHLDQMLHPAPHDPLHPLPQSASRQELHDSHHGQETPSDHEGAVRPSKPEDEEF